jgi:DNA-binding transcriptional regulator YhcF (GntR family)
MISVRIDLDEPLQLYEQVAADMRRASAAGEAGPGERLPPENDLALVLAVNKNVVLRALHVPRDEGLLEFRRGRGITVAGTSERSLVQEKLHVLVAVARAHGSRREEVVGMMIERAP